MNYRFRFRTPVYGPDREFKDLIYWNAEEGAPAISGRGGCVFKEPEQCTGLKDKNGRLIYEGDIVRVKSIYLTNENLQGEVCYGSFYFSACEEYTCKRLGYFIKAIWSEYVKNTGFALGEEEREYEVIGNIHENAVLLEEGR